MSMGNSAPASKDSRETDASMVGNNQFAFFKINSTHTRKLLLFINANLFGPC